MYKNALLQLKVQREGYFYRVKKKKICLGQEYSSQKNLKISLWKLSITSLCDSFPFWCWESLGLAGDLEVLINNLLELLAMCLGVSDYCCYRNSPGWLRCFSFSHISKTLVFKFFFLSFCSSLHLVAMAALLFYSRSVSSTATQTAIITDNRHHKRVCHMPCQLAKLMTQFFCSSLSSS